VEITGKDGQAIQIEEVRSRLLDRLNKQSELASSPNVDPKQD